MTDLLKRAATLSQLDQVFDKCEGEITPRCLYRDSAVVDGQVRSAYATVWELRWIYLSHPSGFICLKNPFLGRMK